MSDLLIGTGGWAYFRAGLEDSLSEYSRVFDFVELNSSYYELPSVAQARGWRKKVPTDFQFSLRAQRTVLDMEDKTGLIDAINHHIAIAAALQATTMVLTPSRPEISVGKLEIVSRRLQETNIIPVIDCRRLQLSDEMKRFLEDLGCVQSVDASLELPSVRSRTLYTRVFGVPAGNTYQFSDSELERLHTRVASSNFDKSVVAFHGVKMYSDAARLKTYHATRGFANVTSSVGLDSLVEVLSEDMKFPATKQDLVRLQGWKLVDLTPTQRVRAEELLARLPDRTFDNPRRLQKHSRHSLQSKTFGQDCFSERATLVFSLVANPPPNCQSLHFSRSCVQRRLKARIQANSKDLVRSKGDHLSPIHTIILHSIHSLGLVFPSH